MYQSHMAEQNM